MPPKTQNAKDSSSGTGNLECSFCGRCFSRPSHHDRHVRTHLPPEGRLSLPCDRCNKTFGRKDVLLRHLRTAHRVDPGPQPKAAQKSCYRCVQLRRKCDREQPCHLCAAGGAVCQYPGQLAADKTLGPDDNHSSDLPQQQQQPLSSLHHQQPDSTSSMAIDYAASEPSGSKVQATPVTMQDNVSAQMHLFSGGPSGAYPSRPHPSQQLPLPQLSQSHINAHDRHSSYENTMAAVSTTMPASTQAFLGPGVPSHDPYPSTTMSHSMLSVTSMPEVSMQGRVCGSPCVSDDFYLAPDTSTFYGSLSAAGQLDFRGTGLDWLAFDVPEIYPPTDSRGMSGIDSTMVTEPPLPQLFQQLTSFPNHTAPPVLTPQQYPIHHRPQHAPHQPQYTSHPHGQQGPPLQHASPGPPTASAPPNPGIPSPHLSYPPPLPAASHTAAQNSHAGSGQVLPWPFEGGSHDHPPQRYSLPPLREVLQSNLLQSTNPVPSSKSVLENLVILVSDMRVQSVPPDGGDADTGSSGSARKGHGTGADDGPMLGASVPASNAPDPGMVHATALLKRLVDTYIAKFQPILPLLHLPTWDMATAPRVLVSAMACVGSLLADDENINGLTLSISDICMPMIAWMGSSDSANYRDISYLSALCVHQIFSLGSGSRQLYQNADRSRGILVGGLRGMGCLTTRLSLEDQAENAAHASLMHGLLRQHANAASVAGTSPQTPSAGTPPAPTPALQEQWLSWMYREREKRTAWSSFEFDCSLCTLTGRRGAVDLSELPSRLPCAETLWDAPSATEWAALRTRLSPDAQGALVSVVMRGALRDDGTDSSSEHSSLPSIHSSTGTPNPHIKNLNVSFWGKRLCAQVIGRLLWDLKQLETLATSEYFGMPSLSAAQAVNKGRLLRALDSLLVSMDQPVNVADLISYNLIGHYSHLYTAHDVLDIILYIVRNTVAHGAHRLRHHKGIQMAKKRLVATLSRDPQEARRLVYHAAQIVAVANDYLVSAPCEILRLFMGYTFLIVFAAYCPSGNRFQLPAAGVPSAPGAPGAPAIGAIQLDVSSHRIASTADVDNWIAHGGPAAIGSVPNLFADGGALAICRDAQAIMQRLKNWGLAEKFTKILQNFESTELSELNA